MFNRDTIKACFEGLVGWRTTASECVPAIDTYNTTSNSGIYFDGDGGPSQKALYACMSKDYASDATGWNLFLKNLYEDSVQGLVRKYLALQSKRLNGKGILSNQQLGYRPEATRNTVPKLNRFVGIEFHPWDGKNYCTELLYLGLWFNKTQTVKMYLYSSARLQPISQFDLEYTDAGSLQLFTLVNQIIYDNRFLTSELGTEGEKYYLGYYEDELDVDTLAIDTLTQCGGCSGSESKKYAEYIRVHPFSVANGKWYVDRTVPDEQDFTPTTQSFGLTASINVTCDLSNIFCDNKSLFAASLQKYLQIQAYWKIYNTLELGPEAELSKEDARLNAERLDLDLDSELKKIVIDFENIQCACIGSNRGAMRIMGM